MKAGKHSLRILILAALVLTIAAGSALAADLPGKGKTVEPARATWTTGYFLEALYSRAVEHLGYEVKDAKEFSNPIFYQSVMQGDVDFWANGWFPIHYAQLPKNFDQGAKIAGMIVDGGAIQGYLVSKKEAEKYNIKTLEDFKRDEVKKAFDANGDGKADMVACPPGWGCEKVITHHMDVYDLNDHINEIMAGYSASMADALARYNAGEPVFFYTWTPNWTVNKFKPGKDVMWIGVPEIIPSEAQEGREDAMVASGVAGAVDDPLQMGWIASDINVVANLEFLDENPAIAKLFEIMSVPMEDIAAQNEKMFGGEDKQSDIERHVDEWIKANQEQWDKWIAEAKKAAM
jgi:glycine betaine/proline transport system substrate-binding protein